MPDDYVHENAANLGADGQSILSLYRALIKLRKQTPALVSGAYVPIAAEGELLLYKRQDDEGSLLIALNLGSEPVSVRSDSIGLSGEILLSTLMDRNGEAVGETLELRGNEGVIVRPHAVICTRTPRPGGEASWHRDLEDGPRGACGILRDAAQGRGSSG